MIERVDSAQSAAKLEEWKTLIREQGWDLQVLLAPDRRSVVALGIRVC